MKSRHRLPIAGLVVVALAIALTVIATAGHDSLALNGVIYVDADAPGPTHDGSTWDYAFTTLQPALDAAVTGAGTQIWVAEGTYTPTEEHGGSGDRYRSFQMVNGVAIYGGFDPTLGVIDFGDRNSGLHETILSGDIGTEGDSSDNSYHVFYHPEEYTDLDDTAILDGFTITGGNANGASPQDRGGGMYNHGSSPTLTNCTFIDNSAEDGGAMRNWNSSPTLNNCIFRGNMGSYIGGGMLNEGSSPTLTGCTFADNSAREAGGMYNTSESSPTLTNCTFAGNSANGGPGGGMYNYHSTPTLTNCTFSDNSAGAGGGIYNLGSSPVLTNCTFAGNSGHWGLGGGGMYNDWSSPMLTNCAFADNSASAGGAMTNYVSSPTLINCTFWGNFADSHGGGMYDEASSPALTNSILWGDTPDEIYDYDLFSSPLVTYSNIQGGYDGVGNIDDHPRFMDPASGDFHLHACSPCIDAGYNEAENLPDHDFEGDYRILDGDGDGTPIVDMGVDEVTVAGTCYPVHLPLVLRNN